MQGQNPPRLEVNRKEEGDYQPPEQADRFVEGVEDTGHVAAADDFDGRVERAKRAALLHQELGEDKKCMMIIMSYQRFIMGCRVCRGWQVSKHPRNRHCTLLLILIAILCLIWPLSALSCFFSSSGPAARSIPSASS